MAKVYFIGEQKLKDNSVINGNVDNKILDPVILECQDLYILPIIGSGIFNELKAQLTPPVTLTALNTTLLNDYIQPCLIKYIEYEAAMYLNVKYTNANLGKKSTDESQPLSIDETHNVMSWIKDKAEYYAEKITKYLKTNYISYPLYLNAGSSIDTVHPAQSNYTCGIYLGDDTCRNCGEYRCNCMIGMRTSSPN